MHMCYCLAIGLTLIASMCVTSPASGANDPLVLAIWPGVVPGDNAASIGVERFLSTGESPTKDAKWLTNVTKPSITVYQPLEGEEYGRGNVDLPWWRLLEPGMGSGGHGGSLMVKLRWHHGDCAEVPRTSASRSATGAASAWPASGCAARGELGAKQSK